MQHWLRRRSRLLHRRTLRLQPKTDRARFALLWAAREPTFRWPHYANAIASDRQARARLGEPVAAEGIVLPEAAWPVEAIVGFLAGRVVPTMRRPKRTGFESSKLSDRSLRKRGVIVREITRWL